MTRIKPNLSKKPWYVRFLFWLQRKKHGKVLESTKIWALSPRLFLGVATLWGALDRKNSPLEPKLRTLITLKLSQANRCHFCVDLNTSKWRSLGGSKEKMDQLENFQENPLFSKREKIALKYAQAVNTSDTAISNTLFAELQKQFSDEQIVELTGLIAFQILSNKFNRALDIQPEQQT